VDTEFVEMGVRVAHVIGIGARPARALAHETEQRVVIETSGILGMAAVDDVDESTGPGSAKQLCDAIMLRPCGIERDGEASFGIDARDLFPLPQVGEGFRRPPGRHAKRHAQARSAAIEPQYEAGPFRRAAVNVREHAERAVIAVDAGHVAFEERETRPPHQRAVAEHPEIARFAAHPDRDRPARVPLDGWRYQVERSRAIEETDVTPQPDTALPRQRRSGRLGLFLPFGLVAVLAAGWCVFWFVARAGVVAALDDFVASEAEHGRLWTCPNRTVAGFPFRFEVSCDAPRFAGRTPNGRIEGGVAGFVALAQAYAPRHVIARIAGPLKLGAPDTGETVDLAWRQFDASVVAVKSAQGGDGPSRLSVVIAEPVVAAGNGGGELFTGKASAAAFHLRRNPSRPETDGAYDLAARLDKAAIPLLDALLASADPATVAIDATLTQAGQFGSGSREEQLERWRRAGGLVDMTRIAFDKGPQQLEATGSLGIDDLNRPQGTIDASVAGLDRLLRSFGGQGALQGSLGGLIAGGLQMLGGQRPARAAEPAPGAGTPPQAAASKQPLVRLPPILLANGRASLGPVPLFPLRPLF